MANYLNVENFFDTENLVDSNNNQIIPIRLVQLESDSDYNPTNNDMNKWKPDPEELIPTNLREVDLSDGNFTHTLNLLNGNYAIIEVHPIMGNMGLENGGTIRTRLYDSNDDLIHDTGENPFPNEELTAQQRLFFANKCGLYIANYHRAGKYGTPPEEGTFGYKFGFTIIPYQTSNNFGWLEDTYYPIPGSIAPSEMSEIPFIMNTLGAVSSEADLTQPYQNANDWMEFIADATVPKSDTPSEDEGKSAQESESDGGNTDFPEDDTPSDNILPSEPPTEQVANVGLYGVWHLYQGDVRVLSKFLWSDDFFDNVIKNMASPLENIISFGMVPFSHFSEATQPFQICNVQVKSNGANYSALKITRNFYNLDCGTVAISDLGTLYNGFEDNEPFTRYWLYLPFIGTVNISTDDIAREGKIKVQYKFDVISGVCVAEIVTYTRSSGWNITSRYSGNILTTFPLTGANYMQMYQQLAGAGLGAVASLATQNYGGLAGNAFNAIMARPNYGRGGGISNVAGLLSSTRKPVLIKARANAFESTSFKHDKGYKSDFTVPVANAGGFISGFASSIELKNINGATETELNEIQSLISSGIYTS